MNIEKFIKDNAVFYGQSDLITRNELQRLLTLFEQSISTGTFTPPTQTEVVEYFISKTNGSWNDGVRFAEKFIAHYEQTGWKYGKRKMKDWKRAAISAWDMHKYVTNQTHTSNGTFGKGTTREGLDKLLHQLG